MNKMILESTAYEYLYQDAAVIMFILDKNGYVLEANTYTKKILGCDFSATRRNFYDFLVNFNNLPGFADLIRNNDEPVILNLSAADGLPVTFNFTFREKETLIFAFGQSNQIEFEAMRKNFIESNQEINNLSRELQKTNAKLIRLNALENEFLGMAAHDLRNPIGIVYQYSELLLEDTEKILNNEQIEMLKIITYSSNFMLGLINDLLDISKIESGKMTLALCATDIVPFIEHNILLNHGLAAKKQIKLIFAGEQNLPAILIDQSKIEQVLNNLISNAIKYSFPGTAVRICASKSGRDILISVQDEGQGIPENEISKLFQAFQTTSVRSTNKEKSTGLGLLITKKIITGHQGRIWLNSKVGVGTTFFFTLPITAELHDKTIA